MPPKVFWGASAGVLGLAMLSGCMQPVGSPAGDSKRLGSASVKVELAPMAIGCLVIQVVGTTMLTQQFNVPPEGGTAFALSGLPIGSDAFSASAYSVSCAKIASAKAAYVSSAVVATVAADTPIDVDLQLGTTVGAVGTVKVDFPGAATPMISEFPVATVASTPLDIVSGPDGNLWFTESSGNKIGTMAPSGAIVAEYPVTAQSSNPIGITAGPDGNLWFVENGANQIGRITPSGTITQFPIPTASSDSWFITPGPDGNLWFAESSGFANNISRITPGGTTTEFLVPTAGSAPTGIAAGPDGNIWFTEYAGNKIGVISTNGSILHEYLIPTPNSQPLEIAAGPDGNLWFVEQTGNRIGRITPSGAFTEFFIPITGTATTSPFGIVAGPDGNLWFTESTGNNIDRITPSGIISQFPVTTAGSAPWGIAAGPDGNIWFADFNADSIGRLSLPTQELVPLNVACIVVQAAGSSTATFPFDVAPDSSSVFDVTELPIGSDTFSAQAFDVSCADSGAATATWISGSVAAAVSASAVTNLTLPMTENPGIELEFISVTPASASLAVGATQQFAATGTDADGTTHDLTALVSWTSNSVDATISGQGGLATGVSAGGPVTITASYVQSGQSFTAAAQLTVTGGSSSGPSCNSAPSPKGGGAQPYDNQAYCGTMSGTTDMGTNFTGTFTFITPAAPGTIIACQYATTLTTSPTACTGSTDAAGNVTIVDAVGESNTLTKFIGSFSSNGTTLSGTFSSDEFGPQGSVVTGNFSGSQQ